MVDSRSRLILLTGASGFVGRHVLRALAERHCRVRVVVREGKQAQVSGWSAVENVVASPNIFAETVGWWTEACRGVDTAIHTAWYVEPRRYLHSSKNSACLRGTLRLAQGASDAKVRRFIGIGTCFEYDFSGGTTLSTHTPLRPLTPYAEAKVAAFNGLLQRLPANKVEFAWCRLFYLYGYGEDERRLVPYLRARLAAGEPADLSSGTQVRDFLDVAEAGRQIAEVALGRLQGPLNICSGIPITVREVAERIADEYGRRDLLRFGARSDNITDPLRIVGVPSAI